MTTKKDAVGITRRTAIKTLASIPALGILPHMSGVQATDIEPLIRRDIAGEVVDYAVRNGWDIIFAAKERLSQRSTDSVPIYVDNTYFNKMYPMLNHDGETALHWLRQTDKIIRRDNIKGKTIVVCLEKQLYSCTIHLDTGVISSRKSRTSKTGL